MRFGFDPGTTELRLIRHCDQELITRRIRSTYALLIDTLPNRQLLDHLAIPYSMCQDHLILLADQIEQIPFGPRTPALPLLPDGLVTKSDPLARQLFAACLDALMPPVGADVIDLCICLPRSMHKLQDQDLLATREYLLHLFRSRGYSPMELTPGRALVLAELAPTRFTGLAIDLGAGSCSYSLCLLGGELLTGYLPKGGDWIDTCLARGLHKIRWDQQGREWLDLDAIQQWKCAPLRNLAAPLNRDEELLRQLYEDLIHEILDLITSDIHHYDPLPDPFPPVTMLIHGGAAQMPGLHGLISQSLTNRQFPLVINEIRLAAASPFTVARGCLIHSHLAGRRLRVA